MQEICACLKRLTYLGSLAAPSALHHFRILLSRSQSSLGYAKRLSILHELAPRAGEALLPVHNATCFGDMFLDVTKVIVQAHAHVPVK
jgi:hypothetical protein